MANNNNNNNDALQLSIGYSLYWRFIQSSNIGLPKYREFEERYVLKYHAKLLCSSDLAALASCYQFYFIRPKGLMSQLQPTIKCDKDFQSSSMFASQCAEKILKQYRKELYKFSCPHCQRLRLTPTAKICLWCAHEEERIA